MTFIIAEIGASHGGSLKHARRLVEVAAKAGADAVKLQTFEPEQMVCGNHRAGPGPWEGRDLLSLYRETHTPKAWHPELFELIRSHGLVFMSTPFHPDDVAFLKAIGCERYKIASFEAVDLELLLAAARTKKPLYVSTGVATSHDVGVIMDTLIGYDVTLMHCVSSYPTDLSQANLWRINRLQRYGPVGISDHTKETGAAPLAVALGAVAVEKHITLGAGQDVSFALWPDQFAAMVKACRQAAAAVDMSVIDRSTGDLRRSVWLARDVKRGETLTRDDLTLARPWSGVSPLDLDQAIGHTMMEDRQAGEPPWTP